MAYTGRVPMSAVPFGGLVFNPSPGVWEEAGMWQSPGRWFGDGAHWHVRAVDPGELVTMLVPDEADAIGMLVAAGFAVERIET